MKTAKSKSYIMAGYFILSLVIITIFQNCSKSFVSQTGLSSAYPVATEVINSQTNFSVSVSAAHRKVVDQAFANIPSHQVAAGSGQFTRNGIFSVSPEVYLAPVEINADSFMAMLNKLDQVEAESADKRLDVKKLNYITIGMGLTPASIKAMQDMQQQGSECPGCSGGD